MKQKCDNVVMKHEKWTSPLVPRLNHGQYKMPNLDQMESEQNGWLLHNDFGSLHYF